MLLLLLLRCRSGSPRVPVRELWTALLRLRLRLLLRLQLRGPIGIVWVLGLLELWIPALELKVDVARKIPEADFGQGGELLAGLVALWVELWLFGQSGTCRYRAERSSRTSSARLTTSVTETGHGSAPVTEGAAFRVRCRRTSSS